MGVSNLPATHALRVALCYYWQHIKLNKATSLSLPASQDMPNGHVGTWLQQQPFRRDSCLCEAPPAPRKVCERRQQPVYILWLSKPLQGRREAHRAINDALSLQLSSSCLSDRSQYSMAKRAADQAGGLTCKSRRRFCLRQHRNMQCK